MRLKANYLTKLTKNDDLDKYKYSGYDIGFDSRSEFLFTDGSMGRNVIIFGADKSSSVHVDNKNKDILIPGERPTEGLDDTTFTAEALYHLNFTQPNKVYTIMKATTFYFLMLQKYINSRQKNSEIKDYTLWLSNISKDLKVNNTKSRIRVCCKNFFYCF